VPVGILGTPAVQPIGTLVPKVTRGVTIRCGKAMDVSGRTMDSSTLRAITDELMANIQALTGQEYVGRYAPRKAGGEE